MLRANKRRIPACFSDGSGPLAEEWLLYQLLGGDEDTLCADCLPPWHDWQVERGCCAYRHTIFHVRPIEKGGGTFGLRCRNYGDKPDMRVVREDSDGAAVSPEAVAYVEKRMGDAMGVTVLADVQNADDGSR